MGTTVQWFKITIDFFFIKLLSAEVNKGVFAFKTNEGKIKIQFSVDIIRNNKHLARK